MSAFQRRAEFFRRKNGVILAAMPKMNIHFAAGYLDPSLLQSFAVAVCVLPNDVFLEFRDFAGRPPDSNRRKSSGNPLCHKFWIQSVHPHQTMFQ
jgi:hypothetical protein